MYTPMPANSPIFQDHFIRSPAPYRGSLYYETLSDGAPLLSRCPGVRD
jgi:hypothetical protein